MLSMNENGIYVVLINYKIQSFKGKLNLWKKDAT